MAARKRPHKHIHNLGAFAHPPKAGTKTAATSKPAPDPKAPRTHLDTPSKPQAATVVRGTKKDRAKAMPPPSTTSSAVKAAPTRRKPPKKGNT